MEPFLGPGPGTADCLKKAATDAGPHQGKLERAMTPSLQEIGMDCFQRVFLKYFREACVHLQITVFFWESLMSIWTSVMIQPVVSCGQEAPYLSGLCQKSSEITSSLLNRLLKQCALFLSSPCGLQILLPRISHL